MSNEDEEHPVGLEFSLGQLIKSLASAGERSGERSGERARQWQNVISGMLEGSLTVGSRAPVKDIPAWVTLEVVYGGFATGTLAAGGPLQPHEQAIFAEFTENTLGVKTASRLAVNLHFLTDSGRRELEARLDDGCFRVSVAEESALLVTAWLLRRGETDRAAELVDTLSPFFDRLRFYPVPNEKPLPTGEGVSIKTAGEVTATLRARRVRERITKMNESLGVWAPLYDRAVALFVETVEGELPGFARTPTGELLRSPKGQPIVTGGWPCRKFPAEWNTRARALLDEYRRERALHSHCKKPEKRKENFALLRGYLDKCVTDARSLSGRDVGMIRKVLAAFITRHGAPGSPALTRLRAEQMRIAARPTHAVFAWALADRLSRYSSDLGVADLGPVLLPLSPEEIPALQASLPIPPSLRARVLRCLEAPLEVLLSRGLVTSSEAMATLLASVTANTRAAAITDDSLRRVYAATYMAFRKRRSVLLVDLASQVKLEELPWISAVASWIGSDTASRVAARDTLTRATSLAMLNFPYTLLPNKFVKELRALAVGAGLKIPLVDELAVDIFMGRFSVNFLRAGQCAAKVLQGSLYERYYGLSYATVLALDDLGNEPFGAPTSPGFDAMCHSLAHAERHTGWSVANNGTIIEQAQIVTTHNLAVLFVELELSRFLDPSALARECFVWICQRLQVQIRDWRARLQNVKNAAYAWRQMVFYLSLLDGAKVGEFIEWSENHFAKQSTGFIACFGPALTGMKAVCEGDRFDSEGLHPGSGGRRFLGWSVGKHWLLTERAQ